MDYNAFLDCQFVMTDNKRIDRVRDLCYFAGCAHIA